MPLCTRPRRRTYSVMCPKDRVKGGARTGKRGRGGAAGGPSVTDRIADVWGEETPYAANESWRVRTDLYLDGVAEADVDRWVRSACPLCSNGCALDIAVKDGRIAGVR